MDINDATIEEEAVVEARIRAQSDNEALGARIRARDPAKNGQRTSPQDVPGADEETSLLQEEDRDASAPEGEDWWPGQEDFKGLPWWKMPSVYWLLPAFAVYALAFGGIIVPKLNLILTLLCQGYMTDRLKPGPEMMPIIPGGNNPQCTKNADVQALSARFTLYSNLVAAIFSAITSPQIGALSDRYGRKKLMAMTSAGMLVGEIITILAATYSDRVSVYWILVGYLFEGLCGSFTAAMALAFSYTSDCTTPSFRNVAFGYVHGCLFTGVALGPLLAGYVIKITGNILVMFYVALGCHVLFVLFLALILPESLPKRRQHEAREKYRAHYDGPSQSKWQKLMAYNLLAPLDIFFPTSETWLGAIKLFFSTESSWEASLQRNLILLATIDTLIFGIAMGSMTIVIYYAEFMFGWQTFESSIFISIVNTCRVITLVVIFPLATRIFRGRRKMATHRNSGSDLFDLSAIRLALGFEIVGYLGYTLSRTGALFIFSGAIASLGGVGSPTLSSAMTKHVPSDRTGQLLGAMGLLNALARVVAPTIFNLIYSLTVGKFTQTVFVSLTGLYGLAFTLSWFLKPHVYLNDKAADSQTSTPDAAEDE